MYMYMYRSCTADGQTTLWDLCTQILVCSADTVHFHFESGVMIVMISMMVLESSPSPLLLTPYSFEPLLASKWLSVKVQNLTDICWCRLLWKLTLVPMIFWLWWATRTTNSSIIPLFPSPKSSHHPGTEQGRGPIQSRQWRSMYTLMPCRGGLGF